MTGGRTARATLVAGALVTVLSVLVLSGCSPNDDVADLTRGLEDAADADPPRFERYVALGDSFTAGPLVPTTDLADGCFRSDGNYPSLVAEQLDIDVLVDVSCSAASTRDLYRRQGTVRGATVPAQFDALDPSTDLVTLGIGGNDFGVFHTLVSTCSRLGRGQPAGAPCQDELARRGVNVEAQIDRIGQRVSNAVRRIREVAPEARILVVGYLRLVPERGECDELPFARGDYAHGRFVSESLNAALADAAERSGATFVDMHEASLGHDICAEEPWVNGNRTVRGEALAFHPFAAGMEAVADALTEVLDR